MRAYYAREMKIDFVLVIAVPLLIGVLSQDNSCSSKRNSGSTVTSSPSPAASVPAKKDSPMPSPPKAASSLNQLSTGTWGGNHVRLEVADGKSSLEFDCASGTIDQPITLDSNGRFEVSGLYKREGPGPVRQGVNNQSRATYSGAVKDDTMTLSIQLDGSTDDLLKFTLTLGKEGRIWKCY